MTGPKWNVRSQPRPETLFSQPGVIYSNRMCCSNCHPLPLSGSYACGWHRHCQETPDHLQVGPPGPPAHPRPMPYTPFLPLVLSCLRLAAWWNLFPETPSANQELRLLCSPELPPVSLSETYPVFCEFQSLKWRPHKNKEVADSVDGLWPWA